MQLVYAILGSGALSAVISGCFTLMAKKKEKSNSINSGVMIILYDRIKYLGKKYISEGYIVGDDLEDIIKMHEIYHSMGGNGFLDKVMAQVKSLPIK